MYWISSFGFHVFDFIFCPWNLDSGFQSLVVGLLIPRAVFRIPRPRIPDSSSKNFPDSGFPYKGREDNVYVIQARNYIISILFQAFGYTGVRREVREREKHKEDVEETRSHPTPSLFLLLTYLCAVPFI